MESFVHSFRPDIMEAVYAWAKGSKFYEIMEIARVFEGSLIRAIRRMEEVLQQLIVAAKSIGETQLEAKLEEAVSKIKRHCVRCISLLVMAIVSISLAPLFTPKNRQVLFVRHSLFLRLMFAKEIHKPRDIF